MLKDMEYMNLALEEAACAYDRGDVPIGAVLTIDDKFLDKGGNKQVTNSDWCSHAESLLIVKNAQKIKQTRKNSKRVELYTTLEPCVMCLGTAVQNRITRIFYSCPDPFAGATGIEPTTSWLKEKWPIFEEGLLRDESYKLLVRYMSERKKGWEKVLASFEEMHVGWLDRI